VLNHVKLTVCNHRLKANDVITAVGSAREGRDCIKASGRIDLQVFNTRHKGPEADSEPEASGSFHAEVTTEGEKVSTAS
jgi:hypothetical protein